MHAVNPDLFAAQTPVEADASGSPPRQVVIYCLSDPRTKEIRYVGKTHGKLSFRLSSHLHDRRRQHKARWIQSLLRAGIKPEIEVLEIAGDDWPECERFWIAYLRFLGCRLCNRSIGGEFGTLGLKMTDKEKAKHGGWKHSEEYKEMMRRKHTGKKMSEASIEKMRRRVFTETHRARLTESQRGNKKGAGHVMTEAHKEILRKRFTGIPLSEEHKAKLRAVWVIRRARDVQ